MARRVHRSSRSMGHAGALDGPLDFTRCFLPEALAGLAPVRALLPEDRKRLNQIRAASYLHLFDMFETALAESARARAAEDVDTRELLAPSRLRRFDLLEPAAADRVLQRAIREGEARSLEVWTVLALQLWCEAYLGSAPPSPARAAASASPAGSGRRCPGGSGQWPDAARPAGSARHRASR